MTNVTDWKMQDVYEMINNTYVKYYNPSQHLAVDEIIVFFQRESVFRSSTFEKMQTFQNQHFQIL
jgi:hypothetical protein